MMKDLSKLREQHEFERKERNKEATLDLLKEYGDFGVSSKILTKRVSHRFGGSIAELRKDGYMIETRDTGYGMAVYTLMEQEPVLKVDKRKPMDKLKQDFDKYAEEFGSISTADKLEKFISEFAQMELRRKAGTKYA